MDLLERDDEDVRPGSGMEAGGDIKIEVEFECVRMPEDEREGKGECD